MAVQPPAFEVVRRHARSSAQEFWCSAGDYATRVLGAAATQKVYLWRPVGDSTVAPGRTAVQFTLSAPPGADTSTGYSLTVKRAGDNLSAGFAQQYCFKSITDF